MMTVEQLKTLLYRYKDDFQVEIKNGVIKITGKYYKSDVEEYINTYGATWEGGTAYAPDGAWCGECSHFDCSKCSNWKESLNGENTNSQN